MSIGAGIAIAGVWLAVSFGPNIAHLTNIGLVPTILSVIVLITDYKINKIKNKK